MKTKMLINKCTKIVGPNVILVPYRKEHVAKYHEWMKSEELQRLTASLPLTLEEEYEMQKSWAIDDNKCTFIVLDKEKYATTNNEIESMIGDTNLFFCNGEDRIVAEAEIMVAEPWARGRRQGWNAAILMLLYGIIKLEIKQYIVKIALDNVISFKMFTSMGFQTTSTSEVFAEVTMNKVVDYDWTCFLKHCVEPFSIIEDDED